MSYLFGDDGTFAGYYPGDKDQRAFVLKSPRACPPARAVADAITLKTPRVIAGATVLLVVEEKVLRDFAATVFSESSHNDLESEGIMRVMRNRAALKGLGFGNPTFWNSAQHGGIGGNGIDGRGTGNYTKANALPIQDWKGRMRSDLQATVRGLVSPVDVTCGAYFWIATRIESGNNLFAKGLRAKPPIFTVTRHLGHSTFLRYNPANPTFGGHQWP